MGSTCGLWVSPQGTDWPGQAGRMGTVQLMHRCGSGAAQDSLVPLFLEVLPVVGGSCLQALCRCHSSSGLCVPKVMLCPVLPPSNSNNSLKHFPPCSVTGTSCSPALTGSISNHGITEWPGLEGTYRLCGSRLCTGTLFPRAGGRPQSEVNCFTLELVSPVCPKSRLTVLSVPRHATSRPS